MLQERFSVSLAFRRALESAMEGLRRQEEHVQQLRQSFLDSVARMKVSGEDPVLLLAALSQSDSHLVVDYDSFSLLASFFGWDSSLNLSSTDSRTFADWIRGSRSSVEDNPTSAIPVESSLEVGPSGLSSEEKNDISTSVDNSGTDHGALSPSISSNVHSLFDTDVEQVEQELDPEDKGVPDPEDFANEPAIFVPSSTLQDSRKFFSLLLLFVIHLSSRGCQYGGCGLVRVVSLCELFIFVLSSLSRSRRRAFTRLLYHSFYLLFLL